MAYKVNEGCAGCGVCIGACPHGAIELEGDVCVIDPAKCEDCGACADACLMAVIAKDE